MYHDRLINKLYKNIIYFDRNKCWEWSGSCSPFGYARCNIKLDGIKFYRVSRLVYYLMNRNISDHIHICHSCDNPKCINPDHLYGGTRNDNMRDMVQRKRHANLKKTHCPHGHIYDEKNTRYVGSNRRCRSCDRIYKRSKRKRD